MPGNTGIVHQDFQGMKRAFNVCSSTTLMCCCQAPENEASHVRFTFHVAITELAHSGGPTVLQGRFRNVRNRNIPECSDFNGTSLRATVHRRVPEPGAMYASSSKCATGGVQARGCTVTLGGYESHHRSWWTALGSVNKRRRVRRESNREVLL